MESESTFVGANGIIELNPEPPVDLNFALIVYPRDSEYNCPVSLDDSLVYLSFHEFRVLLHRGLKGFQYFLYRLMKFRLIRILSSGLVNNLLDEGHDSLLSFLKLSIL
jgi:hypothetical protein